MSSKSKLQTFGMNKASVHDALTRLRAFEANWNGYGAAPPDPQILATAAKVVESIPIDSGPTPQVVPMTRGRVQLEWHRGARSLELEFETADKIHYLKWDSSQGIDEEDVFDADDVSAIVLLLSWFTAD
jgi:hypothetical protein